MTHYGTHRLAREQTILGYMIQANRPLRLQAFESMLDDGAVSWQLFPLRRTTIKSTLLGLVKRRYVKERLVTIGGRQIIYAAGRAVYAARQAAITKEIIND